MAATDVDLANLALGFIAQEPIRSLEDPVHRARAVRNVYDNARRKVLSSHHWNEAIKRVTLTAASTEPLYGGGAQYELPSDYLKWVRQEETITSFRIETYVDTTANRDKRVLITPDGTAQFAYVFDLQDVTLMGANLTDTIAKRIAYEVALALTGQLSVERQKEKAYEDAINDARFHDCNEDQVDSVAGSTWLDSRFGFGGSSVPGINLNP